MYGEKKSHGRGSGIREETLTTADCLLQKVEYEFIVIFEILVLQASN